MDIHEPVDHQKKLNIIAIADASDYGRSALAYGHVLARIFGASLTVVTRFGFTLEDKVQTTLSETEIQSSASENLILPEGYFFPEILYSYAEKTNTIMFVIGVARDREDGLFHVRQAVRFIQPSRLPVMTVGRTLPTETAFQQVVLPLDIERQAKEKALWAGYFSRFYQAAIHIVYPDYQDSGLKKQVTDNVAFVEKLYQNLDIKYEMHNVKPPRNMDLFSITYAESLGATLSVAMMTGYRTLGDWLTGPRERKIIANPQQFPVLCINPREDLYVLCT